MPKTSKRTPTFQIFSEAIDKHMHLHVLTPHTDFDWYQEISQTVVSWLG